MNVARIFHTYSILRYVDENSQVFERFTRFFNCRDRVYWNKTGDFNAEEFQKNEYIELKLMENKNWGVYFI